LPRGTSKSSKQVSQSVPPCLELPIEARGLGDQAPGRDQRLVRPRSSATSA
jgi:hypothetical protein